MLYNYFKTGLRYFRKYKGYSILNILGLTVGIASSLLILLWVMDEFRIDRFHKDDAQLFQMLRNIHLTDGEIITTVAVPQPTKGVLDSEYPEVEKVSVVSWSIEYLFKKENNSFRERGMYVSPEYFEMFSFPFLLGDRTSALSDMKSIVISKDLALKYFGEDWQEVALGQSLEVDGRVFSVTGVIDAKKDQTAQPFDWVKNAQDYISRNSWVESWYNGGFRLLFKVQEGADLNLLAGKVEQEVNEHTNYEADERLIFQRYSTRYLESEYENGVLTVGRLTYVKALSIVAVFILLIACINFMNLATARSTRRAQEVGLRKVMGAQKSGLGLQFLMESFTLTFISLVLSVILVYGLLPYFNSLTGKTMILDLGSPLLIGLMAGVLFVVGLVSGIYPALLLPSFSIINSLKGTLKYSRSAAFFRKGLVTFQFALSILLIVGTTAVYNQIDFIMSKNLGLDRENLVYVGMEGDTRTRFDAYKNELLNSPEISHVTSSSGNPLSYGRSSSNIQWEGKGEEEVVEFNVMMVGSDFIESMKMEILEGRSFSPEFGTDSINYLINEEAARIIGKENIVGEPISVWGTEGQVVGLVKNFHMSSMYEPIAPLIIRFDPDNTSLAFVRIQGDVREALAAIEEVTSAFNPEFPFQYEFLDSDFAQQYQSERTISSLTNIFAFIAIFISCLGLLGLSSYSAERRTRELGIRKVHGANVRQLVMLLLREYAALVILALLVAFPMAYYFSEQWLSNFVYRIYLGPGIFLFAGVSTILIALVTVSLRSVQAAMMNPAHTLRDD